MSAVSHLLRVRLWKHVAPLLDRGFSTRLTFDPEGPIIVLSPHLDDAVLDCWSVITGSEEVSVVNVCARPPKPGRAFYWDRVAGARDSAAMMAQRLVEDREALALAGRAPLNLPFLDAQYRVGRRPPSLVELDAALVGHLPAASTIYAPMCLGLVHCDHVLVRSYALAMAPAGFSVWLYADAPYAVEYGWPGAVTGDADDPNLNIEAYWEPTLPPGFGVDCSTAEVVRLGAPEAAAKLLAMQTYRTQFPTLDRGPIRRLSNPAVHGFEVFWSAASA